MAPKVANAESVLILLSTKGPNNITFPERRILLTQSQPKLKIGRSSNRAAMGLAPTLDNGYFDSPVMSREHAEIEADIPGQVVRIRDAGSMHGTFLNEEPVETETAWPLVAGDEITFGSSVYRNQKTFKPATVTVGVEFQTLGQADHSPSRVFTVPDDCSTDENEPLDDDLHQRISTYISEQINPWKEMANEQGDAIRQMDGIIEIESSSESDSDDLPHDCISIHSSDDGHDAMNSGDPAAEVDDDDESISLTDDEETSSAPASPVDSIDLDAFDLDLTDNVGARSPSWNSVSTDTHSEHAGEQPPSGHNSEDEQGVFLYESESEDMSQDDPTANFEPYLQPVFHQSQLMPAQTTIPTQPVSSVHPTLPSINTAVLSQRGFSEFSCQLAPVMQPAPRQPSPSDAVLPVGRRHHGSEDDRGVTVESLGLKSGKPDFFAAREQNKIKMAHSNAFHAPNANLFTKVSSDTANIDKDSLRPMAEDVPQYPASSATEIENASGFALNKEAHTVAMPQPLTGRMTSPGNGGLSRSSYEYNTLAPEEAPSTAPLQQTSEMDIEAQEAVDPAWTAASAQELFQLQQNALVLGRRAAGFYYDPADAPMAAQRSETPKDTAKGKRKAVDISEATNQELAWQHEPSASDQQPVPSSSAPVQPEIEMDLSRLSFHNTPEQGSTSVRPTKMRKIAERVGYAALGGATVGAMVFTSLIYTAPNFA